MIVWLATSTSDNEGGGLGLILLAALFYWCWNAMNVK
jgi:hypothetical protein